MKLSDKALKSGLSPMRKFHPFAVAAKAAGKKIYHLNIGQPDIETPTAFFDAVRNFELPVLAYAPSPGMPEMIGAVQKYYDGIGMIRSGGSAARPLTSSSPGRKFAHAFAVTASNPKCILFFVAFLPQFVNPGQPAGPQLVLLGVTFVLLSAINATFYSYLSGSAGNRIRNPRFLRRLNGVGGGVMIGAGLLTAVARR